MKPLTLSISIFDQTTNIIAKQDFFNEIIKLIICLLYTSVKVRDVIIGLGACTDSKVNRIRFKDNDFAAIADFFHAVFSD